ncbi:MAG: glycoside hydrolase family 30 beta sandwich domain-containing protein [Candidatus Brocadiia bacterium]
MSFSRLVVVLLICCLTLAVPAGAQSAQITVDTEKQYQTIEGFGTCLVSWVNRFQELYRTEEFQDLYVNRMHCNMMRVNIWGPVCTEPVEDWRDIRWQDFDMSVNGGRSQIFVTFGQGIKRINPDVKIIGTVWSPPAWMKVNNSITGPDQPGARAHDYRGTTNRVDPKYYRHFAKWMVEMVKMHDAKGAPFYAVSPGNEVQFSQGFESCVWNGEDYAEIVKILGEMLEREGYGHVKIFGPETMTSHFYHGGTPDYVRAIAEDPEALEQLDVFATHGYSDNGFEADTSANSSRRFWEFIEEYGKPFWITEGGTGSHEWPAPLQEGVATGIHNALVAGNVSAYVPWQVIGRARNSHCLMVLEDGEPVFTPKSYAAIHYFRFIPAGSVRVDASPAYGEVKASAFLHEESGRLTTVLLNPDEQAKDVTLSFAQDTGIRAMEVYQTTGEGPGRQADAAIEDGTLRLTMPAESIVTLSGTPD